MKPEIPNLAPPVRHWAWTVALLYGLALLALTVPVIRLAFWSAEGLRPWEAYQCWPYWTGLLVMVLCQWALLAIPVRVAVHRPVPQRSIFLTVLVCGLMAGLLALGAGFSIVEFVYRGQAGPGWLPGLMWACPPLVWLAWTAIFFRISRRDDASSVATAQCRRLLQGSALELLIAVPTHIVARHRNYCCAGFMTFLGLTTGIAVMLFAFGPSVFQLYLDRWRRLHPPPLPDSTNRTDPMNRSTEG